MKRNRNSDVTIWWYNEGWARFTSMGSRFHYSLGYWKEIATATSRQHFSPNESCRCCHRLLFFISGLDHTSDSGFSPVGHFDGFILELKICRGRHVATLIWQGLVARAAQDHPPESGKHSHSRDKRLIMTRLQCSTGYNTDFLSLPEHLLGLTRTRYTRTMPHYDDLERTFGTVGSQQSYRLCDS